TVMAFEHSGVAVSLLHHAPAYHVDAASREVQGLLSAYTEVTGQQGYAFSIGGGTYSRMMPGCVAFGPCFPGEEDLCHVPDEFMDLDKLMTAAKIYALAVMKLAC
ncbi:MAG: M20/M25/M40 family metallo-hydrolase, partial [Clostridia bacterium]|nr:M20/M25/M40 family metallo-hydrolase [Clostridia bacterium]